MFVASQSNGRRKRLAAGLLQQANLKATGKMLPGPCPVGICEAGFAAVDFYVG